MKKIIINGAKSLFGEITISGAKNSVVALIPAAILAESPVILEGVPKISDVFSLIEIIELMGAKVKFEGETLYIDPREIRSIPMPSGKINSLRASYYFMGALLGRFKEAVVGLPGGCDLGPRPIDLHIKGFNTLGVEVRDDNCAIYLTTKDKKLVGNHIFMDMVSVGATINIMLAAVKAEGRTVIENAAREPEIIDVATFLNNMGAHIRGAGTNEIRIDGVNHLSGAKHSVVPDRIEAGTYLSLAAAIGQGITLHNVIYEHIESFISKLEEMGVKMVVRQDSIFIEPNHNLQMIDVKTSPYPGVATDLQQPLTPLLLQSIGTGSIIDTIYPGRINHVPELQKMGAEIAVRNEQIILSGPNNLVGTDVYATDLRAGACLVNAGLIATGTTVIHNADVIMRGYHDIIGKLTNLGADISLVEEKEEAGARING